MTRPDREVTPDRVFDGGDLDCGSGLTLLLRENMLAVPPGGVLEMRSREPTVADDLPPWCRLSGHEFLGARPGPGFVSYFVRRGSADPAAEERALETDKARAREVEWRARVRVTGPRRSSAYCRNLTFPVGAPASFDDADEAPSAVELLLGALGGDVAASFATECARDGIALDDVEVSVKGRLADPLAGLGLSAGDPGLAAVELRCFATTFEPEEKVRAAFARAVARSPLGATLSKAAAFTATLAIV